ncbi:MAG: zf-HC2 domain-containing protein [Micropruina sp.]|nr:zf-HC2 domain-containing protein [Micropruina sp.]
MKQSLIQLITCHWTARRVQRYLDADPSALLTPAEVARIEAHLAMCAKCTQVAAEHRALHGALSTWWGGRGADPHAEARLQGYLDGLTQGRR